MISVSHAKEFFCTACGAIGALFASFVGGWTDCMSALILFIIVDCATGFMVAAVFHNSEKTKRGRLDSSVGWVGLCRKIMTLVLVVIAHQIDVIMGSSYIRDGVTIAFIVNELLSILENATLMGIDIPKPLKMAIDTLKDDNDKGDTEKEGKE